MHGAHTSDILICSNILLICSNSFWKFAATISNLQQLYSICSNFILFAARFLICSNFILCVGRWPKGSQHWWRECFAWQGAWVTIPDVQAQKKAREHSSPPLSGHLWTFVIYTVTAKMFCVYEGNRLHITLKSTCKVFLRAFLNDYGGSHSEGNDSYVLPDQKVSYLLISCIVNRRRCEFLKFPSSNLNYGRLQLNEIFYANIPVPVASSV